MNVAMNNKMNKNILMIIFSFMIIINSNVHHNIKINTKIINGDDVIKKTYYSSKNNTKTLNQHNSDECSHKYQNTKIIIRLNIGISILIFKIL